MHKIHADKTCIIKDIQVLYLLNNVTRNIASLVAKFLFFLAFKRRKTIIDCIDMGLTVQPHSSVG